METIKVLVTGGTGFIGSYLVEQLVEKGAEVRVLTRTPSNLKWIEHLRQEIEVIKGDITVKSGISRAIKGVETVFHLAAIFSHTADSKTVWKVNYQGTVNIAEEILLKGCRLVHVSTVGVLGPANSKPLPENSPLNPNPNPYARSKAKAEKYVLSLCQKGLDATIARPAFVYGPRSTYGVNLFIKLIIEGKLRVMIGNGENYIYPVHAHDVANALLIIAHRGKTGESYNIANEKPVKLKDFTNLIAKYTGIKVKYGLPPLLARLLLGLRGKGIGGSSVNETIMLFTKNWFYEISKLRELGWKQTIPLNQGLKETIEWLLKHKVLNVLE